MFTPFSSVSIVDLEQVNVAGYLHIQCKVCRWRTGRSSDSTWYVSQSKRC